MSQVDEAKLQAVFCAVLNLPDGAQAERARQLELPAWDSLAHVSLIAAVESEFGIVIELTDQLELVSYEAMLAYLTELAR
jgi:acyl carrier protein